MPDRSDARPRHPSGKFQPGVSGNPKGRPPGIFTHASTLVRTLLEENAAALTQKVIAQALDGNPIALKLCLDRLAPPPQNRAVQFNIPTAKAGGSGKQTPDQILAEHNAILHSVAEGAITPQEGQSVSAILEGRRRSWESAVLADRITALEDRADDCKRSPSRPTVRWVRSGERAKDNEAAKESDDHEDMENEEDTEVADHGVDDESAETINPRPQGKRSIK